MSSEQSLHVVIKIPYKRPLGFVEPPSIVWTEEMEQKLWEILTQNKRQSIDWNAASRLLNVPVPYLLRHAAFLYETQLRGVQMELRRGEALSASNSTIGSRKRASSRASLTKVSIIDGDGTVIGHQRPPSAMSNASREQYVTSRGGYNGSQDMIRTGSNTSLTDGRRQAGGSASSSINVSVAQSIINESGSPFQVKNALTHTQATPSPQIVMTSASGRPMSPSSSVSTITTDQVMKHSIHITHKQDNYSTALSTVESSSTNECFATPAASATMPLSRTLSNPLSLDTRDQNMNLDDDSDDEDDSMKKSNDEVSFSERFAKLQMQDLAAFLPISASTDLGNQQELYEQTQKPAAVNTNDFSEDNDLIGFRTSVIDLANLQQPATKETRFPSMNKPTAAADSQQSLSANDSANSSSSLSDLGSVTQSELESAYLEASKMSISSSKKSTIIPVHNQ